MQCEAHCPVHNRPSLVLTLSQIYPVHTLSSHFFKIHFNIFLLSTPRYSKLSLSFRFPHPNPVCILSCQTHAELAAVIPLTFYSCADTLLSDCRCYDRNAQYISQLSSQISYHLTRHYVAVLSTAHFTYLSLSKYPVHMKSCSACMYLNSQPFKS